MADFTNQTLSNFISDSPSDTIFGDIRGKTSSIPCIKVIGVGGAGGNAVNNMIAAGDLKEIEFAIGNTDAQALELSRCPIKFQLGAEITGGLGAGADPKVGAQAAEEAKEEIYNFVKGADMLFITSGMGGGTGTGGAPIIAKAAKALGVLTIAVVTKPFIFEGPERMKVAEEGLAELQKYVDIYITISNQNLFRVANEKTTLVDAFKMADDVLHSGIRCVAELAIRPGLINLDFADIRTTLTNRGSAMMGAGEANGPNRAIEAADIAVTNPLLDNIDIENCETLLINITGGTDMTLFEANDAVSRISEKTGNKAKLIFGSIISENMEGIRVSVVAAGIGVKPVGGGENSNRLPINNKPVENNTPETKNHSFTSQSKPETAIASNMFGDLSDGGHNKGEHIQADQPTSKPFSANQSNEGYKRPPLSPNESNMFSRRETNNNQTANFDSTSDVEDEMLNNIINDSFSGNLPQRVALSTIKNRIVEQNSEENNRRRIENLDKIQTSVADNLDAIKFSSHAQATPIPAPNIESVMESISTPPANLQQNNNLLNVDRATPIEDKPAQIKSEEDEEANLGFFGRITSVFKSKKKNYSDFDDEEEKKN